MRRSFSTYECSPFASAISDDTAPKSPFKIPPYSWSQPAAFRSSLRPPVLPFDDREAGLKCPRFVDTNVTAVVGRTEHRGRHPGRGRTQRRSVATRTASRAHTFRDGRHLTASHSDAGSE